MRIALPVLTAEIAALAVFYFRQSAAIAGGYGFPLDDSWIHSHFARNMAEGRGFVYNPGQPCPSSSLLYTLALSAVFAARPDPVSGAAALGLLLHLGASALVYAAARVLCANRVVAGFAAVAFAGTPRLVWGALSGMEVPLYVFLVALGVLLHVRHGASDGLRSYLSTAAFSLAAAARPECAALAAFAILDRTASARRHRCSTRSAAAVLAGHLLLFCLVVFPVVVFNLSATGRPLQPAFYTKTAAGRSPDFARTMLEGVSAARAYLGKAAVACFRDNAVVAVAVLPGVMVFLRRLRSESPGVVVLPAGLLGVPIATALCARTGDGGLQMLCQMGRYSAYLAPLAVVTAAVGVDACIRVLTDRRRPVRRAGIASIVTIAAASIVVMISGNLGTARVYARQVENISQMQAAIGKWAYALPDDAVIAVNDAGAIAYFSRKRIIDIVGVVNPELHDYRQARGTSQHATLEYLRERRPDYIVIFPDWCPIIAADARLEPIRTVRLDNKTVCGEDRMVVFKAHWGERAPNRSPMSGQSSTAGVAPSHRK